jgi:hypothetical protein
MAALLKKYEEELFLIRSHKVDKENKLYHGRKAAFESYEDCYQNCAPTVERLGGLENSYARKVEVANEMMLRGRLIG